MNTTPSLESVQADFQQWRHSKTRLRGRTPDELRHQALALCAHHSPGEICKVLGITRGMLRAWDVATAPHQNQAPDALKFVALPVEAPPPVLSIDERLILALTQANGDHWSLEGNLTGTQLHAFVAAFYGGKS